MTTETANWQVGQTPLLLVADSVAVEIPGMAQIHSLFLFPQQKRQNMWAIGTLFVEPHIKGRSPALQSSSSYEL